jgi:hypothetical protein
LPEPALAGSRLDARFGYGFAAFHGRGVLTPFGTASLHREYGNGYRIGTRLAVGRSTNLSLEAERRERTAMRAMYAVFMRGAVRFQEPPVRGVRTCPPEAAERFASGRHAAQGSSMHVR